MLNQIPQGDRTLFINMIRSATVVGRVTLFASFLACLPHSFGSQNRLNIPVSYTHLDVYKRQEL